MPVRTRRWNDPAEPDDGLRLLVTRYRPRGLPKEEESWEEWRPDLGPSRELLARFKGKSTEGQRAISWAMYEKGYLREMRGQAPAIAELARRVADGETVTLLCASACTRESRCHRSLLKRLIEAAVEQLEPG